MVEYSMICEVVPGALADSARVAVRLYTCPTCSATVQQQDIPGHEDWHTMLAGLFRAIVDYGNLVEPG